MKITKTKEITIDADGKNCGDYCNFLEFITYKEINKWTCGLFQIELNDFNRPEHCINEFGGINEI